MRKIDPVDRMVALYLNASDTERATFTAVIKHLARTAPATVERKIGRPVGSRNTKATAAAAPIPEGQS